MRAAAFGMTERAARRINRLAKKTGTVGAAGRGRGTRGRPRNRPVERAPSNYCESVDQKDGSGGVQVLCLSDESTGDVGVYEMVGGNNNNVNVSPTPVSKPDLKAELAISDANARKWEKVANDRKSKIEELECHVKMLEEKVKELVAEQDSGAESKMTEEMESLRQGNDVLTRAVEHSQRLFTKALQQSGGGARRAENGCKIEANGGGAAAAVDGSSSRKDIGDREGPRPGSGFVPANIGRPDQFARDGSERPASEKVTDKTSADGIGNGCHKVGSNQCLGQTAGGGGVQENGKSCADADVTVDIMEHTSDEEGPAACKINGGLEGSPRKQSATSARWENGSGGLSTHGSNGGREGQGRQVLGGAEAVRKQQQGVVEDAYPEALFTEGEYKLAQNYVDRDFLAWLNKRIRRPTPAEIAMHKDTVFGEGRGAVGSSGGRKNNNTWAGIKGTILLHKYSEEINSTSALPFSASDLTTMFRTVMHISGSRSRDDFVWCLVWTDCMNPEDLPGYTGTKRSRVSSPDESGRAVKARNGLT